VVLVGKAQEGMKVWRGWVDKSSPRSTDIHLWSLDDAGRRGPEPRPSLLRP
jgi:hypothetical protein